MVYDCIVIGQGPAGISASIYLKRANKNVLTIGKDLGVLESNKITIENYYGLKSVSGIDIAKAGIDQALSLGCEIVTAEVLDIKASGSNFIVTTDTKKYESQTIIIATGQKRTTPKIARLNKYIGKGVSFCVTCDGFFFRNKKVGIIGNSKYMLHELNDLASITNDITVFTNGEPLAEKLNYPIVEEKLISISGNEDFISSVTTAKNTYEIDGLFVALGFAGGLDIARKLGILTSDNEIMVNESNETNIKGAFAAGDIIKGKRQIVKAAYDGMLAASGVIEYLYNKKKVAEI